MPSIIVKLDGPEALTPIPEGATLHHVTEPIEIALVIGGHAERRTVGHVQHSATGRVARRRGDVARSARCDLQGHARSARLPCRWRERGFVMKPGNRSKRSARRIEKARHKARRYRKLSAVIMSMGAFAKVLESERTAPP